MPFLLLLYDVQQQTLALLPIRAIGCRCRVVVVRPVLVLAPALARGLAVWLAPALAQGLAVWLALTLAQVRCCLAALADPVRCEFL